MNGLKIIRTFTVDDLFKLKKMYNSETDENKKEYMMKCYTYLQGKWNKLNGLSTPSNHGLIVKQLGRYYIMTESRVPMQGSEIYEILRYKMTKKLKSILL